MKLSIRETLKNALIICNNAGVRLTEKRKRTLYILLDLNKPISAYEFIEEYKRKYNEAITAMSAYRMLNFLVNENLAHKLQSVNKYTACSHINCNHGHGLQQFLICDSCDQVDEILVSKQSMEKLTHKIEETGFLLNNKELEFHGTCQTCQTIT